MKKDILCNKIQQIISIHDLSVIPNVLINCLIVAEDHRFWRHNGFDIIALIRAFCKTIFFSRREGGSTIAMQLVRTITFDNEVKLSRKLREIFLAYTITMKFDRIEISKAYLLTAYYGWNMHGLLNICNHMNIKSINDITIDEASSLVARLKYPEPRVFNKKKMEKIERRSLYIKKRYFRMIEP